MLHRGRLQGQRRLFSIAPRAAAAAVRRKSGGSDWPAGFEPLEAKLPPAVGPAEDLAEGVFMFLGLTRRLEAGGWHQTDAPRLWRFHLHYHEWVWTLLAHDDQPWARAVFRRLWEDWRASCHFARQPDAWATYPIALRLWVWCGAFERLVSGSDIEGEVRSDVALHAGYLRASVEYDIGGNHVVKDLKALIGAGVFLGDRPLIRYATRRLARQIRTQVLPDGGHYERSPSYHCQVLGDLIDVTELLRAAGERPIDGANEAIQDMQRWLGHMLMPDGDVPLFNDCVPVGPARLSLLQPVTPPSGRLTALQPSGYVVIRYPPSIHAVLDVGPPCPPGLPAHAHADCLSFELAMDGRRVIVDTGTTSYEPGPTRDYERSTAAHNTVEIDGENQTEVWGAFRAGRRARPSLHEALDDGAAVTVEASHDGYRFLPGKPVHRRTWRFSSGRLSITDRIEGAGTHRAAVSLFVAGEIDRGDDALLVAGALAVHRPIVSDGQVPACPVSAREGGHPGSKLRFEWEGALPATMETVIEFGYLGNANAGAGA